MSAELELMMPLNVIFPGKPSEAYWASKHCQLVVLSFPSLQYQERAELLNVFKTHSDISGLNIEHISHINISQIKFLINWLNTDRPDRQDIKFNETEFISKSGLMELCDTSRPGRKHRAGGLSCKTFFPRSLNGGQPARSPGQSPSHFSALLSSQHMRIISREHRPPLFRYFSVTFHQLWLSPVKSSVQFAEQFEVFHISPSCPGSSINQLTRWNLSSNSSILLSNFTNANQV